MYVSVYAHLDDCDLLMLPADDGDYGLSVGRVMLVGNKERMLEIAELIQSEFNGKQEEIENEID